MDRVVMLLFGLGVGIVASFSGLGGGFLMVPILLALGYTAQKAAGTSLCAIFIICLSALFYHVRMDHVDWRAGLVLGLGGMIGAQLGGRFLESVSTGGFRKIFAVLLLGIAMFLFIKK